MRKLLALSVVICAFCLVLCACEEAYGLSFSAESYTVQTGTCFKPDVKTKPKGASYALNSGNSTIAAVSENSVTALKQGVVKLTATSGDKTAECTLYVVDEEVTPPDGAVILPSYRVGFEIVNYEDAGLSTGALEWVNAVEGSFINVSAPVVRGYEADCWYLDKDCTQKFLPETKIYQSMTLYARLAPKDTAYNVVNGYIAGLLYPNLPHEELALPEAEENGGRIYGIADEAFMGDKTIRRVVIPASYETLGTSAFAGCTALEEVVIPEDSALRTVGTNAFGVIRDENGKITDACSSLSVLKLPDTVTRVGSFAFFNCAKLAFDGIPPALTYVEQYAFAGTKINNVSLRGINRLYEGAFNGCASLDTVTETENVTMCDKLVFRGTKLAADASAVYAEGRRDDDAAFYAGTILFGCYPHFGKSMGSGKLRVRETTTLIADEAFTDRNQGELTLYIDTETAASALNRDFIGGNVFAESDGVFVVVGKGLSDAYRRRYSADERDYADRFVEEEIVEVVGDDNEDVVNRGRHILLKRAYSGSAEYFYDRFVPSEKGSTRIIKLSGLRLPFDIVRVNMSAFNSLAALEILELGRVGSIAHFAVANCSALKRIDLTGTITPAKLESSSGIQFTSVPSARVYVKSSDLSAYRSLWQGFPTAYGRLTGE